MQKPLISIAIFTYNRGWLLGETLTALQEQSTPLDVFEIVVVNNASTDNTAQVIQNFSQKFPFFKNVYEPSLGQSHARNAALYAASTEWVCYLDDDAKAAPNYVEIALRVIAAGKFVCFGGAILPWRRDPLPTWFLDEYEYTSHHALTQETQLTNTAFVFGGNMAVRKDIALSIGGFDANFGMQGKQVGYGEETEFQTRIHAAGHALGYIPDLLVYHYARPEKYTFPAQWRINYKLGVSWQMLHRASSLTALGAILVRLIASPAKGLAISLWRLCTGSYTFKNCVLEVSCRFIFTIGRIIGWLRLRQRLQSCR